MEKKNLAIIILAVVLAASGVGNVILAMMTVVQQPYSGEVLRVATTENPVTIDPMNSWDSVSNNILDQVGEPLLATDLTNSSFPIVGRLAESWIWLNLTTIEFHLRPDVIFHNGQPLTGEDVIYTFERINYFGNTTGTLPDNSTMAFPHSLYKFNETTPIFDTVASRVWWNAHKASNPLVVRLYLNAPFAPAEGLLSYTASDIVGHTSTPKYKMLDLATDLFVGTGPFKLIKYAPNSEVRFARWERYWRTGAYWDQIVYVFYRDAVTANNAMLAGDIDFLGQGMASLKQDFIDDPDITVTGDGVHDYINGSIYWYMGFNSQILNRTWRMAISTAFNYTYLIQDILEDTGVKAGSLVPPGFPAHNSSVHGPTYDIEQARLLMQSMGYGLGWQTGSMSGDQFTPGANEADWLGASFVPPPSSGGNFTTGQIDTYQRRGSNFMANYVTRLTEDMHLIGISIHASVTTWADFIRRGQLKPGTMQTFFVGWGPDYFETFNMIDPLVNNASSSNFCQINDPYLQNLLKLTAAETDTATRYAYYEQLQGYIIDVQYYHMPLWYDKQYYVHAKSLMNFPYNTMRNLYFYPTYREVA